MWSVCWSYSSEYELISGDQSGQARVWDIRRAGCLALLDQYCTQRPQPRQVAAGANGDGSDEASAALWGRATDFQPDAPSTAPSLHAASNRSVRKKARSGSPRDQDAAAAAAAGAGAGAELPQAQMPRGLRQQHLQLLQQASLGGLGPPAAPDPSTAVVDQNRSTKAHHGSITCIAATPDGLNLVTSGTDDRVRCWDAHLRHNVLVNYADTVNSATRCRQLAVSDDSRVLFSPCGSGVQVFELHTGRQLAALAGGHFGAVHACVYNSSAEELYTGGNDCQVLAWRVKAFTGTATGPGASSGVPRGGGSGGTATNAQPQGFGRAPMSSSLLQQQTQRRGGGGFPGATASGAAASAGYPLWHHARRGLSRQDDDDDDEGADRDNWSD